MPVFCMLTYQSLSLRLLVVGVAVRIGGYWITSKLKGKVMVVGSFRG